jgi:hypothetical protein
MASASAAESSMQALGTARAGAVVAAAERALSPPAGMLQAAAQRRGSTHKARAGLAEVDFMREL